MEKREEIVVLDAGREAPGILDPEFVCCFLSMGFYRG